MKTVAGLKGLKLGAQVGTTSYDRRQGGRPGRGGVQQQRRRQGRVDATARSTRWCWICRRPSQVQSELTDGVIVGQLPPGTEKAEQFGIVLDKGSPLTACVSKAVDELGNDGELFKLQKMWLTGAGNAPVLS